MKCLRNTYISRSISHEISSKVVFLVDCAAYIYDLHTPSKRAFEEDMSSC